MLDVCTWCITQAAARSTAVPLNMLLHLPAVCPGLQPVPVSQLGIDWLRPPPGSQPRHVAERRQQLPASLHLCQGSHQHNAVGLISACACSARASPLHHCAACNSVVSILMQPSASAAMEPSVAFGPSRERGLAACGGGKSSVRGQAPMKLKVVCIIDAAAVQVQGWVQGHRSLQSNSKETCASEGGCDAGSRCHRHCSRVCTAGFAGRRSMAAHAASGRPSFRPSSAASTRGSAL